MSVSQVDEDLLFEVYEEWLGDVDEENFPGDHGRFLTSPFTEAIIRNETDLQDVSDCLSGKELVVAGIIELWVQRYLHETGQSSDEELISEIRDLIAEKAEFPPPYDVAVEEVVSVLDREY